MQIPGLRGLKPFTIIKESVKDFIVDDMATHASALSYQVFFSLFPFVIFLVALLGFLHLPDFFEWLIQRAELFFPREAMTQVEKVIKELQQPQGGLLSFGVALAIWSASGAVRAIMNALNVAYDVEEGRPLWKLYPLSILYTVAIAATTIIAAALFLIGPQAIEWLANHVGLGEVFVLVWTWVRWPLVLVLMMLIVAIVYYVAPDVEQDFRFITPGAVIAVISWVATSLGFNYYVSNFSDYNAMYGSIGTIIVLLLYFFLSSAVLLFGAELNAVIEDHAPTGKNRGDKKLPD